MRLSVTIVTGVLLGAILGASAVFCKATVFPERPARPAPENFTEQPSELDAPRSDSGEPNDISAYYGFEAIEIIKFARGIKDLRIADFNGDKRLDIALANNRKARIELLLQKQSIGPAESPGAIDPEDVDVNLLLPPSRFRNESVAVSQRIHCLVCGDLNSDGLVDLAFYGEPRGLYVILQKSGQAEAPRRTSLNWQTRKRMDIEDGLVTPDSLVCADLNNDGRDDLALAGRESVYVILQQADSALAEPVRYRTTSAIRGITAGDLNGDSLADLVIVTKETEKPVHVRFGLPGGQLGPELQFFIEKPFQFKLCNIDGIEGDEILTVDALSQRLACYALADNKSEDADWPILFYPLPLEKDNTNRDLVVGDFDGDGQTDIIVSAPESAELAFYKQVPQMGLSEPVRFPALADIASLSAADIDHDGKAELAVLSVKEKIIGISKFISQERLSFPTPIRITGEPLAMELADVEHDGTIDCVYVSKDTNNVRSLRIACYKPFAGADSAETLLAAWRPTPTVLELKKLSSNPDGIKVLDVDQDGLEDVLIFVKYEAPILVRQVQRGKFELIDSPGVQSSLIKDASLSTTAVADVDGRAGKELLLAQKNFARSLVFARGETWSVVDQYNARSAENAISAVGAFDIEGLISRNRPAILLLDGQKGQLQVLKAADDMTYRFSKSVDVGKWNPASHLKMLFGRFTGRQVSSLLLFDSVKFAILTPPVGGDDLQVLERRFIYDTQIKDGAYGNFSAGDINSDDRADIIMVEYKRHYIEILALGPDYKPTPAMRFKIFEEKSYRAEREIAGSFGVEPHQMEIADVTADGKADLVTLIHDRVIIYPQD